jgi:hypothetical protein
MPNGKLDWSLSFKMPSFWLLSFTSLALLASQVGFYRRDERLSRFADDAYCLGFIREKKLEAMARLIAVHPEKAELLDVKKLADELGMKL